ncbi:MAG: glycosyltransferase family A protein [Gemmatimonadota bacterium]
MDRPLISCVVPSFDSEGYVAEALESILDQTWRPLEVIVVDDGSTDGTCDVVRSFGDPVRLLTQETAGPAATRNRGLKAARASFVAFLDADDLWHPEKLERQMARLGARPELDYCITHVQMFWPDDMADEEERFRGHRRSQPVPGFATTTLLARKRAFDRLGDFGAGLWFTDATDWFVRAREEGLEMEVLPDTLVYHRMHPSNLTRRREAESREEFLAMIKRSLDRRRDHGDPP